MYSATSCQASTIVRKGHAKNGNQVLRERFQLLNEPASQRTLSQAKIARNYDCQRIEVEEKRVKDERRQVAKAIAKQNPLSLTIAWFRMFESRRDAPSVSRKLARPP
jgi:hypothetical protein